MRFAYPFFLVLAALVPLAGLFWSFLRARRKAKRAREAAAAAMEKEE